MATLTDAPAYGWWDFEQGDSTPEDVHYITILNPDGDEIATIVHRVSAQFPIDGDVANEKRKNAQFIVDALNATIAECAHNETVEDGTDADGSTVYLCQTCKERWNGGAE